MPKRARIDEVNDGTHTRYADKATWNRIMNRRREHVNELSLQKVRSILAKVLPQAPNSSSIIPANNGMSPREQLIESMWDHMAIASDSTPPAAQRLESYKAIKKMFFLIDRELKQMKMLHSQSNDDAARRSDVLDQVDLSASSSTASGGGSVSSTNLNVVGDANANFAPHRQQRANTSAPNVVGKNPVVVSPTQPALQNNNLASTTGSSTAVTTTTPATTTTPRTTTTTTAASPIASGGLAFQGHSRPYDAPLSIEEKELLNRPLSKPQAVACAASQQQQQEQQPTDQDVLLGRGGKIDKHPGNRSFRQAVQNRQELYHKVPKFDKKRIAQNLVLKVQESGGRFMMRLQGGKWQEVPQIKAIDKASQALRERSWATPATTTTPGTTTTTTAKWNARLQQLKEFIDQNGDALVPPGYKPDPSFWEWVHRQREEYNTYMKNPKPNPLLERRIAILKEVGFNFTVDNDKWMEQWSQLKEYRKKHGDCLVPTNYAENPKLANWVRTQRYQNRMRLKGKKPCLTVERFELLNQLDFPWVVRGTLERLHGSNGHFKVDATTMPPAKIKKNVTIASQSNGIVHPHEHDVLSGRGMNNHAGNEHFRALVRKHKVDYVKCPKPQKGKFSKMIVDEIKSRNPPGRFLKHDAATKLWYDIGEKEALDKTRQALRGARCSRVDERNVR